MDNTNNLKDFKRNTQITSHRSLAGFHPIFAPKEGYMIFPDSEGRSLLTWAAARNYDKLCEILLLGEDINAPDEKRRTALMWSTKNDNTDAIDFLLRREGINVNAQDQKGQTALMYMAKTGDIQRIRILLTHRGWNLDIMDQNGLTALMIAEENGHEKVALSLLSYENAAPL
jgi:ankyrin repeat protein